MAWEDIGVDDKECCFYFGSSSEIKFYMCNHLTAIIRCQIIMKIEKRIGSKRQQGKGVEDREK